MKAEQIEGLNRLLLREENCTVEHQVTATARRLQAARKALSKFVREIGRGGDLPLIVATEKTIIEGDLERYANSPMMASSLRTALTEITVIEKHIAIVDDPARYQPVNEAHSLPRNRRGDLPYHEARQALASLEPVCQFFGAALGRNRDELAFRSRRMGYCPCKRAGRQIARFRPNPKGRCLFGQAAALQILAIAVLWLRFAPCILPEKAPARPQRIGKQALLPA